MSLKKTHEGFQSSTLEVASKLSALVCGTGCRCLSQIAADNRSDHSLLKKMKNVCVHESTDMDEDLVGFFFLYIYISKLSDGCV